MLKKLKENTLAWIKELEPKSILLYLLLFLLASLLLGTLLRFIFENITSAMMSDSWHFRARMLIEWQTWVLGVVIVCFLGVIFAINGGFRTGAGRKSRGLLGGTLDSNTMEQSPPGKQPLPHRCGAGQVFSALYL